MFAFPFPFPFVDEGGDGLSKCCAHSSENLNEKERCVDVEGGVSLSVEEVAECMAGRERESAVAWRASARDFVGLVGSGGAEEGVGGVVEARTLFMNVQRFLVGVVVGASGVSFGVGESSVSEISEGAALGGLMMEERRFETVGFVVVD